MTTSGLGEGSHYSYSSHESPLSLSKTVLWQHLMMWCPYFCDLSTKIILSDLVRNSERVCYLLGKAEASDKKRNFD